MMVRDNQFISSAMPLGRPIVKLNPASRAPQTIKRPTLPPIQRSNFIDIVKAPKRVQNQISRPVTAPITDIQPATSPTSTAVAAPQDLPPFERQFALPEEINKTKSIIKEILSYLGIIIISIAAGSIVAFSRYSYWLIAIFAIAAVIFRIKSQITFFIALLFLATVPILLLMGRQNLANNYATYSFLLLAFGVFSATLELKTAKD